MTPGPQRFSHHSSTTQALQAVIGKTVRIQFKIFGFPEPRTLILQRRGENGTLSPSGRHSVQYRAGVLPFGVVTVTIPDVAEADVTNYTLTVDNGVGEPLNKNFSLYLDPGGWVTDITLLFFSILVRIMFSI